MNSDFNEDSKLQNWNMQNGSNLWTIKNIDCVDNEDYYIKRKCLMKL